MKESAGQLRIGLIADFNTQNFAVILRKAAGSARLECLEGAFGQVTRLLLDSSDPFWAQSFDAVAIWTLPELAVPAFRQTLRFEGFASNELLGGVDAFCDLIQQIPASVRTVFVPTWNLSDRERGLGAGDLVDNVGVANALMRMNLRLVERLNRDARVVLFDSSRWMATGGPSNSKLWYMSKTPFANPVMSEAATDMLAALEGLRGRSKKVIIVDLDNTLWGGVVGDEGWEGLRLGGHDPIGEAFVDLQNVLKRLTRRGIILAIASKNEESTALDALHSHPEMILKPEDFAAWRINWNDKASNIVELMAELNLGLDSAVFLDDSAFERARVREALPELLVPDLSDDPIQYPSQVARLKCFDNPRVTIEDRVRTSMYVADRERTAIKGHFESLDQWLQALGLRVQVARLNEGSLERASQLFNKTNQMNLSTRRMTSAELLAWSRVPNHQTWTFRVADKFGDYGLCGVASLVQGNGVGQLADFIVSCRVLGRGVEDVMLCTVTEAARNLKCSDLIAHYLPTAKNRPCLEWLTKQKSVDVQGNEFKLPLREPANLPTHVQVDLE